MWISVFMRGVELVRGFGELVFGCGREVVGDEVGVGG
jgi:hypothetical protein